MTGGLQGIDIAIHMAFGDIFLPDMGIQIDALHVVVPFSVYVGITQQAFVQSEIADNKSVLMTGVSSTPLAKAGPVASPLKLTPRSAMSNT